MKIYQFFRDGSNDQIADDQTIEKYPLYAVTNNKKYAKIFRESRKNAHFIEKTYSGTKEECLEYMNRHRGEVLDWYGLNTRKNLGSVKVLMTEFECDNVLESSERMSPVFDANGYVPPNIFKRKIYECLEYIGYPQAYLMYALEYDYQSCTDAIEFLDELRIDALMVFLNYISSQLNEDALHLMVKFN